MSYKTEEKLNQALNRYITFYIGKSPAGNDEIRTLASDEDLWFHIDEDSSAHIIAIIPVNIDKKQLQYIVTQGAVLCKEISPKYKNSTIPVNILYARVKNVQKTEKIGTVLVNNGKIKKI